MPDAPRSAPVRRRGLGRGLDALLGPLPDAATTVIPGDTTGGGGPALQEIRVGEIDPNPEQPRTHFDETALDELAASIRTHGLLHPIVVERDGERYRLVAGERRWRAAQRGGLDTIAAIIRPASDSARHTLELALTENLVRSDLSPMEEAAAYSRLVDTFGLSHEAVALRVGRSRPAVSNTIRLLELPASVQQLVVDGSLSAGHARALLGLKDDASREAMAHRVMGQAWNVRRTERAVREAQGEELLQDTLRQVRSTLPGRSHDDEALRRGLESALGLPVTLERRRRGGRVVVEFAGDEDLDALYRRLGGPPL